MDDTDELSLQFSQTRSYYEVEFVRAMLADPVAGAHLAIGLGVDKDHFQIHEDMRIMFIVCMMTLEFPGMDAIRIATLGLAQAKPTGAPDGFNVENFRKQWMGKSEFFRVFFMCRAARRLIALHDAERSAREHFQYATRIVRAEVAA